MIDFGYWFFATATLATHIFIGLLLVLYFVQRSASKSNPLFRFFQKTSHYFVFASTLTATLGSLFFSEIAQFAPCVLCWYQRIFIYPQALISYIGAMRDESRFLRPYLIALNIGGFIFSLYHNFILWFPQYAELVECTTKGGPSCIEGYQFYYGYITIPLMALTVIVFNLIMMTIYFPKKETSNIKKPN